MSKKHIFPITIPRPRSVSQVAEFLGVSIDTVKRLIASGDIRATHVASRILVSEAELSRILRDGVGRPRQDPQRKRKAAASRTEL